MPRIPWQELVVAVAGPAVNVAIGAALIAGFFALTDLTVLAATLRYFVASLMGLPLDERTVATVNEVFTSPSFAGYAVTMLIINIMLVLFNMIPAFPMDGGRVFRSLLAMGIDYRKATRIASRVGLGCACLLAFVALSADPPRWLPVLIAAFVGYAGMAEARQVEVTESVRGLKVGDVMVRSTEALPMDMPISRVIARWKDYPLPAFPVVSIVGTVVGMLYLTEIQRALATGIDPLTPAGRLINHESSVGSMRAGEPLGSALMRTGRNQRQIPVVDELDQLCGIVDLETMIARGELTRMISAESPIATDRFDRVT